MADIELKPCPFCGSKDIELRAGVVFNGAAHCKNCSADVVFDAVRMIAEGDYNWKTAVTNGWNNRAEYVVPRSEVEKAKQEVAMEIFEEIEKRLAMYSHIHKYAEEAKHSTEEYADGTPCEMTSVWEVLSLHKNGWDDYETMCQLQDNIGNIEKSRILKEIEGDFTELKKKYEVTENE